MSTIPHFTEIELAITDKDALLAALAEMEYKGKVEVDAVPVTGYPLRLRRAATDTA